MGEFCFCTRICHVALCPPASKFIYYVINFIHICGSDKSEYDLLLKVGYSFAATFFNTVDCWHITGRMGYMRFLDDIYKQSDISWFTPVELFKVHIIKNCKAYRCQILW